MSHCREGHALWLRGSRSPLVSYGSWTGVWEPTSSRALRSWLRPSSLQTGLWWRHSASHEDNGGERGTARQKEPGPCVIAQQGHTCVRGCTSGLHRESRN